MDIQRIGKVRRIGWTRAQVYLLLVLMLVSVSNYLDRGLLSILQEPMKRDLQLSDLQLAIISGPAFAIFYSLFGLPIARLAERRSRARVLAPAIALWSLMTVLCGVSANYLQLVLARVPVTLARPGAGLEHHVNRAKVGNT